MKRISRSEWQVGWGILALVFAICLANEALGQECPRAGPPWPNSPSRARTLEGRLVYHDGMRQWLELKLDKPQCGQRSVQLTKIKNRSVPTETLRGCRVRSTGAIDFSPTGYYSLDTYQDVQEIEPIGACSRQPPFRPDTAAKPDELIQTYRVEMHINYRPGDHPIVFHVWDRTRELRPWQAYADYWMTGGFVLYGLCSKGFVVDKVFGTPEANPMHFDEFGMPDDMAAFDPERAAAAGKWDLRLGYTCVREPLKEHH